MLPARSVDEVLNVWDGLFCEAILNNVNILRRQLWRATATATTVWFMLSLSRSKYVSSGKMKELLTSDQQHFEVQGHDGVPQSRS